MEGNWPIFEIHCTVMSFYVHVRNGLILSNRTLVSYRCCREHHFF